MAPEGADAAKALKQSADSQVQFYSGDDALEERFKQLARPRQVVLITHGYFLPDQPAQPGGGAFGDAGVRGATAQGAGLARLRAQENPLYRSGVVLAGANTLDEPVPQGASVEDGWLTAEEISQLDLRGTDLVVLSACNTSRGEVAAGDAVAGLRSAFLFAGAETIVGSLFEVPDTETRELMRDFYAALGSDQPASASVNAKVQSKLTALNRAKQSQIDRLRVKHAGVAHPFFWASFVLVGEP
jgi:CHAT domain-containing protein